VRALARLQPYSLMLVRVVVGIAMVYHSWGKVMPTDGFSHAYTHHQLLGSMEHFNDFVVTLHLPRWLGYVSTITEFVGGLFLIVGLLTRFWAALIAINMVFALVTVNVRNGYSASQYSIALLAMALMLLTAGSGNYSLDRRLGLT
jgi:putative oxidoreductase